MTLLLSRSDIEKLLPMEDAIVAVEAAFGDLAAGKVTMPQRSAIRLPAYDGLHLGMPAYLAGVNSALGLKVVTVYPRNPVEHNLPTTIGVLLLSDPATGAPLAVMEAGFLTALRTGAVGGVAAKYLARQDAKRVGVFGAGQQARTQLRAACAVRRITSAKVYDIDPARARSYAAEMSDQLAVKVESVADPASVVRGADILVAASSSASPLFKGQWLEPGQHINAIGSHSPDRRELDTETIVRSKVFPDLRTACLAEAGDLLIPIREGAIAETHLGPDLGEVVAGKKPGRESDQEITVFKSVGLAIQDIAAASLIYRRALEKGVGTDFSFSS